MGRSRSAGWMVGSVQPFSHVARVRYCIYSVSHRDLHLGSERAARIVERMEREGVVSPPDVNSTLQNCSIAPVETISSPAGYRRAISAIQRAMPPASALPTTPAPSPPLVAQQERRCSTNQGDIGVCEADKLHQLLYEPLHVVTC